MSALAQLRLFAWLEGLSYLLLLLVAMPLKYLFGLPLGVRVVGSVHGLLFLLFIAALVRVASEQRWSKRHALLALGTSLVPGGMLWLDRMLKREGDRELREG